MPEKGEKERRRLEHLRCILQRLPDAPGCYQFFDIKETIIYVGKASSLKSRVSSYFSHEINDLKTKILVSKIFDIGYTVVRNESDALLLENSLIKRFTPRYNVLLKDGKTYPSICVTKEECPRIYKTRKIDKQKGTYYGPFSNIKSLNALLSVIKKVYKPRSCRLVLSSESIKEKKHRVCLEYHIKNCMGVCAGYQSIKEYNENIYRAVNLIQGRTRKILSLMNCNMEQLSDAMRFEEAEDVQRNIFLIENFRAQSEVVSHKIDNVDVFTIDSDEKVAFINFMHVSLGSINQSYTIEFHKRLGSEKDEDILALGIIELRERFSSSSPEVLIPFEIGEILEDVSFIVPQRGDRLKLLELSLLNCRQYRLDRLKQAEKLNPDQRMMRILKELQSLLHLDKLPFIIECFDNSNISGSDPVASCVVFKGLRPSKSDYRKYNITTVRGSNDCASMKEVVFRRYNKIKEEGRMLPDLIIVDGGRAQMEAAREIVVNKLGLEIPIAGLSKNIHHRTNELLFGSPPVIIGVHKGSEIFNILTQIQDEMHRFAIKFHREKRSKHQIHSELDDISGVGKKTIALLLDRFRSVKRIKEASDEALIEVIGASKARKIREYFSQKLQRTQVS